MRFLNLANDTIQKGASRSPRACCTMDGAFKTKGCSKPSDSGWAETTVDNPLAAPQLFHQVDLSLSNRGCECNVWRPDRTLRESFKKIRRLYDEVKEINSYVDLTANQKGGLSKIV